MHKTLALVTVVCCAVILPAQQSYSQFEKTLGGDQEILHALNRLTFGPRPGDVEAVKKMGLSKWIDLQLHPERIPENEALEALTKPLVEPGPQMITLAPGVTVAIEQYVQLQAASAKDAAEMLGAMPQDQAVRLLTRMPLVRERALPLLATDLRAKVEANPVTPAVQASPIPAFLTSAQIRMLRTPPDKQGLDFLAALPQDKAAQVLEGMPAVRARLLSQVAPELRAKVVAVTGPERTMVMVTAVRPAQLITPQETMMLRTGTDKEALEFLATLPEEKVVQVLAQMPAVRMRLLPLLDPALRRKVEAASPPGPAQPGQFLAQAKLYRALQSDRQLEEVLVDFWYNHFNVDAGKTNDRYMAGAYERDAIRPHVLGKFRELLEATANSPAMMFYLDNWQSTIPTPGHPTRGLNENYARELMELHTLGVDGGYTQKDIVEVARCFTGWTIDNPALAGPFQYNEGMHDAGAKTVLGVTIPAGGGKEDGEKVLDILAQQPSTAKFISRELAQRFVADDPPPALVERMAKTFRDSDGDIRAVLATLFASPEFFSEGAYRAKLKTPFEMVVSAVRATGASVDKALPLVNQISALGQPLYRKLEPTGYSNVGSDWTSSAGLMGRMNFAMDLVENQVDGVQVDAARFSALPDAAARQVLFTDATGQTLEAIGKALSSDAGGAGDAPSAALVAGMLLGSPDFQRR